MSAEPTPTSVTSPPLMVAPSPRQRLLYSVLGSCFVVLGGIGLLLPVMPTTPFLLVALWAYARSSPRMHAWLWHHRWFGAGLQRWHRERTIAPWVKIVAIGSMLVSTAYTTLIIAPALPWRIAICVFMALCIFVVARMPTSK